MIKYRPEVDGLRAIAVIPVIIFHMGVSIGGNKLLPGGFVGVDVFFVISGYLIAGILIDELNSDSFSFGDFYERRARRILPALFLVIVLCVPPAFLWMDAVNLERFAWSLGAVSLFLSNILYWSRSGYFSAPSESDPLSHTWSLGIEEQFYFVFPLFLFAIWRLNNRRILTPVFAVLCFSFMTAVLSENPQVSFYSPLTRAWELLAGVLLAVTQKSDVVLTRNQYCDNLAPGFGLLIIVFSALFMDQHSDIPGWEALFPVTGALLILAFAGGNDPASRLLKSRPIVAIGLVSYALYLWHQPLFAFLRIISLEPPPLAHYIAALGIAALGSTLSYHLLEKPLRNRAIFRRKTITAGAIVSTLFVVMFSAVVIEGEGFPERWSSEHNALAGYQKYPYKALLRDRECLLHPDQGFNNFGKKCFSDSSKPFVLWGDSLAASMYHGFAVELGEARVTQVTTARCPPIIGLEGFGVPDCKAINDSVLASLLADTDSQIFLHANWAWYEPANGISYGYYQDDYWRMFEETLNTFSLAGKRVNVIGSFPIWHPATPQRLAKYYRVSGGIPQTLALPTTPDIRSIDKKIRAIASRTGHRFISVLDDLCPKDVCKVTLKSEKGEEVLLQWDSIHPTREGGLLISRSVLDAAEQGDTSL